MMSVKVNILTYILIMLVVLICGMWTMPRNTKGRASPAAILLGFEDGKQRGENIVVRKKGLEPLRPFGHQLLRLARLPIPPLPRGGTV